jgi:hypothetical protein
MAKPSPILEAHVFLLCRSVQWDGPAGPRTSRTLEQVAYTYYTDVPDGFPHETDFWAFARLVNRGKHVYTRELFLTMVWIDDPRRQKEVWTRSFNSITFRPATSVRDIAVPISAIFEGAGRYEFRLWHPVIRKWDRAMKRRTLARGHIRIEG